VFALKKAHQSVIIRPTSNIANNSIIGPTPPPLLVEAFLFT